MKKLLLLTAVMMLAIPAMAIQPARGFCEIGNTVASVSGMTSTGRVQGSFPRCRVTVYLHGTTTPATIYSDAAGTPLANPFTANLNGSWVWFAADGRYDTILSGGDNGGFPTPFTLSDITLTSPDSVNLASPPPIGNVTPNTVNATTLTAKSVNTVLNPTQFAGADLGAKIAAAIASVAGDVTVLIPSNPSGYTMSTAVANTKDGVTIECADTGSPINWTPLSGTPFKTDGTQRVAFRNCTMTTTANAGSTATCLQIGGTAYTANTLVDNWSCGPEGTASDSYFAKGFLVTGNDTTGPSGNTRITNSHARGYTTCGFCFDHSIDPYLLTSDAYAPSPNTSGAVGLLVDTGASGLHVDMSSMGNAGTKVQNSMPTTGAYGKPPNYMQVTNSALCDTTPGNGLVFDSSLDTLSGPGSAFRGDTYALTNIWCSGAGYSYSGTTPAQSAVVINGGTQFHLTDMLMRYNKCNGIEINAGDHIYIDGGFSRANNAGNYSDGDSACPHASGVYVAADVSDIEIRGMDMRGTNSYESAHQLYGMYIAAGTGHNIQVYASNAKNEQLADISNNATGAANRFDLIQTDSTSAATFRERTSFLTSTFYFDNIGGYPGFNLGSNDYWYYVAGSHQVNYSLNGGTFYMNPTTFGLNSPMVLNAGGGINVGANSFTDGSRNTTVNNLTILGSCSGACGSSLPDQTGHAGQFLGTDGILAAWSTPPGGGNVTGPGTSTTNFCAAFADGTGTLLKNTSVSCTTFNAANQLVQMTGLGKLPSVDGSGLTNVNAVQVNGAAIPASKTVVGTNGSSQFVDATSSVVLPSGALANNYVALGGGTNAIKTDSGCSTDAVGHMTCSSFIGSGSSAGYSNWGAGSDNGVPGAGYMGVQAPTSIATPYRMTWPTGPPTGTQYYTCTDPGSHNLSCAWATPTGSGTVNSGTDQHLPWYSGTGTTVGDSGNFIPAFDAYVLDKNGIITAAYKASANTNVARAAAWTSALGALASGGTLVYNDCGNSYDFGSSLIASLSGKSNVTIWTSCPPGAAALTTSHTGNTSGDVIFDVSQTTNLYLHNVTINCTGSGYTLCFGMYDGTYDESHAFKNLVAENLTVTGDSDAVYNRCGGASGGCTGTFLNYVGTSGWDVIAEYGGNRDITYIGGSLTTTGTTPAGSGQAHCSNQVPSKNGENLKVTYIDVKCTATATGAGSHAAAGVRLSAAGTADTTAYVFGGNWVTSGGTNPTSFFSDNSLGRYGNIHIYAGTKYDQTAVVGSNQDGSSIFSSQGDILAQITGSTAGAIQGNGTKVLLGTGSYTNGHGTKVDASGNIVDTGAAVATVTSVGLTPPTQMTTSGSPVTGSGTITLSYPPISGPGTTYGYTVDVNAPYVATEVLRRSGYYTVGSNPATAQSKNLQVKCDNQALALDAPTSANPLGWHTSTSITSGTDWACITGGVSGITQEVITGRTHGYVMQFLGRMPSLSNSRFEFGVTTAAAVNTQVAGDNVTSTNAAYIAYSSTGTYTNVTDTTHYMICTSDTSSQHCTSLGVNADTSPHRFTLYEDVANSRWCGGVDANAAVCEATNNPAANTTVSTFWGYYGNGGTLTAPVISQVSFSTDWY